MYKTENKPIEEAEGELMLPRMKYKTVVTVREDTVFRGRTIPMPSVLLEYLGNNELKAFAIILKHHREFGCCILKTTSMASIIGITHISLASTMTKLRNMGLVYYVVKGKKRDKVIDWDAVQKLEEITRNWKPGGAMALRKRVKDRCVTNIQPSIIREIDTQFAIYDDPVENEEYD